MQRPQWTVTIPSWLFSDDDLEVLILRINAAIEASMTPITETEQICLGSINIELSYRKSEVYSEATKRANTLMQEPKP